MSNRMYPLTLALIIGALVAGCTSQPRPRAASEPARRAAPAFAPAATVIAPTDDDALTRAVRQTLTARGWHVVDYQADMTRGRDDYSAMARVARYRLTLDADHVTDCRQGDPGFRYRLAMIENASGDVPVSLSGMDCQNAIEALFVQSLATQHVAPSTAR